MESINLKYSKEMVKNASLVNIEVMPDSRRKIKYDE